MLVTIKLCSMIKFQVDLKKRGTPREKVNFPSFKGNLGKIRGKNRKKVETQGKLREVFLS